jgi:hypothetical protein
MWCLVHLNLVYPWGETIWNFGGKKKLGPPNQTTALVHLAFQNRVMKGISGVLQFLSMSSGQLLSSSTQ